MNIIAILLLIILAVIFGVIPVLWFYGVIWADKSETEFTYYSIGSTISNIIGLIIFAYSVLISTNYTNLPSNRTMNFIFYSYMFLFFVTFIIILLYLGYKKQLKISKKYITTNSIFLLILVPFIIYRNQLYFETTFYDTEKGDFIKSIADGGVLDNIIYKEGGSGDYRDDETGEEATGEALEIRKRAAESEYNERKAIEDDVYA